MLKTRAISSASMSPSRAKPGEYRRHVPTVALDNGLCPLGQNARDVFEQSAARDMRDAVDDPFDPVMRENLANRPDVNSRRGEQRVGDGLPDSSSTYSSTPRPALLEDDLAHQAEAVGVQAARGQSQHDVAGRDRAAIDDAMPLDYAYAKAGQVVVARAYRSGMIAVSPPNKCAIALQAADRDARDNLLQQLGSSFDMAT